LVVWSQQLSLMMCSSWMHISSWFMRTTWRLVMDACLAGWSARLNREVDRSIQPKERRCKRYVGRYWYNVQRRLRCWRQPAGGGSLLCSTHPEFVGEAKLSIARTCSSYGEDRSNQMPTLLHWCWVVVAAVSFIWSCKMRFGGKFRWSLLATYLVLLRLVFFFLRVKESFIN